MKNLFSCLYLASWFLSCSICCMAQDKKWMDELKDCLDKCTDEFYYLDTDEVVTNPPVLVNGSFLMNTNDFYTVETNELYYVVASRNRDQDKDSERIMEVEMEDVITSRKMYKKMKDPESKSFLLIAVGGREIWRKLWVARKVYHSIGDKIMPVENKDIAFFEDGWHVMRFMNAAERGEDGEFLFTARRMKFMDGIAEKYNLQDKLLLLIIGTDRYFPMAKGGWWYNEEMKKIEQRMLESSSTTNSAEQPVSE